jgi:hypothetical protein
MKKEEVNNLIREYLALRKEIDYLREERRGVRDHIGKVANPAALKNIEDDLLSELRKYRSRFEKVGDLLYGYRSKSFIQSVISCVVDLDGEYDKDRYYNNFLDSLISILMRYEEYDAGRRDYVSQELLNLHLDKVE